MAILKNEFLKIEIDDAGRLVWFENLQDACGNLIVCPKPLFRVNLHTETDYEDMAHGEDQSVEVSSEQDTVTLRVSRLVSVTGVKDISLDMSVKLDGDHIRFDASVRNSSASTVSELFFPCFGAFGTLDSGKMDLLWPHQMGLRYGDIGAYLAGRPGPEDRCTLTETYPGPLSMDWMMLTGRDNCLYLASEDETLYPTALRVVGDRKRYVSLEINKMCFVRPGETWQCPRAVARFYKGHWHEAAREYAAYASAWRHPVEKQDWIRRMNGYFLVINKQQYGDEMWPYETLPELYKLAEAHGYDTLGLFGWYHTGHDNNYPDLEPSPTMGGREGLEEGIRKVHEMGGRVTLYFQGHLMDVNSAFYKKTGYKIEGRTIYNNPYYESYPKANQSDFARNFSLRVFATACPSCTEWHELMAERLDWIASFGADGILYDQIGGMPPYPCFNESHPHMNGKPSLSFTQGRRRMIARIREQAKKHPGFAVMSEHATDCYSPYFDCMHGIETVPTGAQNDEQCEHSVCMMPELFRYSFPDMMITVRNAKPTMYGRYVNYGFLFGLKYEMEVRYRTDQQDIRSDYMPWNREYMKTVADFRRKHEKYLLLGTFRDTDGIDNPSRTLYAVRYEAEDGTSAIALWNSGAETRSTKDIRFEGKAVRWETPDASGDGMIDSLGPDKIAIVLLD